VTSRGAAAGEDGDGAAVDRAGGQRAPSGEFDAGGAVLAAEHQHIDHLLGRLGFSPPRLERRPQLIECLRPGSADAFLSQRQ